MWDRLGPMTDAGSSALFETTLDNISSFMGPGYYNKTPGEIGDGFSGISDLLGDCLGVLGMRGCSMSLQRIIETRVPELVERTKESFRRLQQ